MASRESTLSLNCLLYGEESENIFVIDIPSTATVYNLKVAIKEFNSPTLAHIASRCLLLWKVSIPVDSKLDMTVNACAYEKEEALKSWVKLSSVFGDALDGYLHILVRGHGSEQRLLFWVFLITDVAGSRCHPGTSVER